MLPSFCWIVCFLVIPFCMIISVPCFLGEAACRTHEGRSVFTFCCWLILFPGCVLHLQFNYSAVQLSRHAALTRCWLREPDIWWPRLPRKDILESCFHQSHWCHYQLDERCRTYDVRLYYMIAVIFSHFCHYWPIYVSWWRWIDQMGNIHGRFEPANSTDKALLIGSHMVSTQNY